ncbi:MAG: transmembrane 220 family protein [Flavobacteriaceae bacterium]
MKVVFNVLAAVFLVLFLYAVYVQNNDPDAMLWYLMYGVAAVASILFLIDKLPFAVAVALFVGYLVGVFMVWPEQFEGVSIGAGDITNIERGREALGLLIVAGVMLVYALGVKYIPKL